MIFSDFLGMFLKPLKPTGHPMENILSDYRLLFDLDGVLFDFNRAACEVHGVPFHHFDGVRREGEWCMLRSLGILKNEDGRPMTLEEFWQPINIKAEHFWRNLKPLPWFDQLKTVIETRSDIFLVSDPGHHNSTHLGKLQCVKKHFGDDFDRLILTKHKHLFAGRYTILIDDKDENISHFVVNDGLGIVFPTKGGSTHKFADDPVSYVVQELERIENACKV